MDPRISHVQHLKDYRVTLTFTNGTEAAVDLRDRIVGRGGAFRALQDPALFAQVRVDSESGTIVFPNGVDFSFALLYAAATGGPAPVESLAPLVPRA